MHSLLIVTTLTLLSSTSAFYTWQYPSETLSAFQELLEDAKLSACLNPKSIQPTLSSPSIDETKAQTHYAKALETWLAGFCELPPCDDDTLAKITKKLSPKRAKDQARTTSQAIVDSETEILQVAFPQYRDLMCLRTEAGFCLVPTLASTMAYGLAHPSPFSKGFLHPLPLSLISGPSDRYPKEFRCSDCHKATISLLSQQNPKKDHSSANSDGSNAALEEECGTEFVDGCMPKTVVLVSKDNSIKKCVAQSGGSDLE